MPKFVFLPPQDDDRRMFAARLADTEAEWEVASPETDEEAMEAIRGADGVYGWVSPEALKVAEKLSWVQNPDAGPFFGYYYPELIEHPLTICNPRGIYFDHISHHILMFLLALSRGLYWYMDAQRRGVWTRTRASRRTSTLQALSRSSTASAVSGTRRRGCATN